MSRPRAAGETRRTRKSPDILTAKQVEFTRMMIAGKYTIMDIRNACGIAQPTYYKWLENPLIHQRIVDAQGKDSNEVLDVVGAKDFDDNIDVDQEIKKRALKDFHFFRKEFLGRTSFKCQKQWIEWIEAEDKTVLLCPRNHGKSTTIIDYCIWRIVKDRSIRILMVSRSSKLAARWVASIKRVLEGRGKYKRLVKYFGAFKPLGVPEKWKQSEIIVEGPPLEEPPPTLSCYGMTAAIYGLRADLIFCDDIVDTENSDTEEQREKVLDTLISAIDNILDVDSGQGVKLGIIGTRKHPLDLYNHLKHLDEFSVHTQKAVIKWDYPSVILCPERFDIEFFRKKRSSGLRRFNREFQNAAFDDKDVIVPSDAFDGEKNLDFSRSYGDKLENWYIIISVDPGLNSRDKATFAMSATAYDMDGADDRHLIDWYDGMVPSKDQPRLINSWYHKYGASALVIEINACQKYLMDSVIEAARTGGEYDGIVWPRRRIIVKPHVTRESKISEPRAGLDIVGHYFETNSWHLPAQEEEDREKTDEFVQQICGYTYREHKKAHQLMTLWFAENEILSLSNEFECTYRQNVPDFLQGEETFVNLSEMYEE